METDSIDVLCLNVCILKCKLLYSHYPDIIASRHFDISRINFDEYGVFDVPSSEFLQWLINYLRKNILNSGEKMCFYTTREH